MSGPVVNGWRAVLGVGTRLVFEVVLQTRAVGTQ